MSETTNSLPEKRSPLARRKFIGTSAAAAAGIAVAGTQNASAYYSWFRPRRRRRTSYFRNRHVAYRLKIRLRNAYRVRTRAAYREYREGITLPTPNRDEQLHPSYIGNFTKTLPHNDFGEVDPSAYESLPLNTGKSRDFDNIPLSPGASARLANPQAAFAYSSNNGADSHSFAMPAAPEFSSAWEASEMGEVYLHAILRDIPFDDYSSSTEVSRAVDQLNAFTDFRGPKVGSSVTADTLFRGETDGDLIGNYISQFLLLPVPQSGTTVDQFYPTPIQGFDHMVSESDWINILRGGSPTTSTTFDPETRYITTGRDLAEFVHTDFSYQAYLQAALILLGRGTAPQSNNPYLSIDNQGAFVTHGNQGAFVTHGPAEILTTIANVALQGLKTAWYHKWVVHRRLRPEVFGGHIHFTKTGDRSYDIHEDMLNSTILDDIFDQNGNYLLPMAYPEGSPTHPAYPAGHAVIAGACCTVLKAFFDEDEVLTEAVEVVPGSNASQLQAYSGGETLTVGNELNKLGNNISLGRDIAGVHWRTDGTEGMLLGERVAISYLEEQRYTYSEGRSRLSFTGFEGNTIRI